MFLMGKAVYKPRGSCLSPQQEMETFYDMQRRLLSDSADHPPTPLPLLVQEFSVFSQLLLSVGVWGALVEIRAAMEDVTAVVPTLQTHKELQ